MKLATIEFRLTLVDLCFVILISVSSSTAADELKDNSVSSELSEQYLLTRNSAFLDYLNNRRWKRSENTTITVNASEAVQYLEALNGTTGSDTGVVKGLGQANGVQDNKGHAPHKASGFKYIAVGVTVIMFMSVLTFMTYYFIKIKYCTKSLPDQEGTGSTAVLSIKVPTRTPTRSSLKSVPEMAPLTGFKIPSDRDMN